MKLLAIILLCLFLLFLCPVTLRFRYDGTPHAKIRYLFFFYTLPLDKPQKKKKEKKKKAPSAPSQEESQEKKKGSFGKMVEQKGLVGAVSEVADVLRLLLQKAARLLSHARVPRFSLTARIGGEDAAQAAINFGGVCAAVYPLLGFASALMRFRSPHLDLRPDYESKDWSASADITLRIALFWIPAVGISALWALFKNKIKQALSPVPSPRKSQPSK